ncbi:MAG: ChbG/HpnK family deacetylase [Beijerinckiaceae bacterium]|nr:ChbG/HpnK family deacetylase [Beijerinckiaceae bacterium]
MLRGFVLCADDFAMTPGVSKSIIELAGRKRLSATSAMTNRPHWSALAHELAPFRSHLDVGLHLNLTLGAPLTHMARFAPSNVFPSIGDVTKGAFRRTLPASELAAEIDRQFAAFEEAAGAPPDFVDGHQHVHALPMVRTLLIEVIARRYPGQKPYLRNPGDRILSILRRGVAVKKALGIATLSKGLASAALRAGIGTNDGFSGFSAFDAWRDYGADFRRFLRAPGPRQLIMCHPGDIDDELLQLDPVVATRPHEANFLKSADFAAACAEAGMELRRFSDL